VDDNGKPAAPGGLRALARREVTADVLWAAISRPPAAVFVLFAIASYLRQYFYDREYWLDENSLAAALRASAANGFFQPLGGTQLAPPGFVAVERVVVRVLGDERWALRLFPLVGAVAAVLVYSAVARRCLNARAFLIALALYAVSDDLIYFSAELKQYILDVAAGLGCTMLGLTLASGPTTFRRFLAGAAAGAVVVWFSHPAAFVLAGVGTVLFVSALARRAWREAIAVALMSLVWLVSFAGVYRVGMTHLDNRDGMWAFWSFAFPVLPPRTVWDALWPVRRVFYLFVNPLNFETPLGATLSALPAVGFFLVGCVSLARRDRLKFGMLVGPALFALLAAYSRLYPFHGRLVLFLVPSLLILVAEGAECAGRAANRRWVWCAILGSILAFPTVDAVWRLVDPRYHRTFNPHGDLRPESLDPATFPFPRAKATSPGEARAREP